MKKSEMPARSLEDRRIFLEHLTHAGWNVNGWDEAFDADTSVEPEAEASYAGPIFDLRLEHHANQRNMVLEMVEREGQHVLALRLHPRGDLAPLLEQITAAQDNVDPENLAELVKALIPLSEPLLVDTNEGVYRLS